MEHIRLIHFPNCRMVTSGTGFFGDENFTRFEKLLAAEARTTPYPMDFLTGNEHGVAVPLPGRHGYLWHERD